MRWPWDAQFLIIVELECEHRQISKPFHVQRGLVKRVGRCPAAKLRIELEKR
jgi:hypothetical protein